MLKEVGKGTFGSVLKAIDAHHPILQSLDASERANKEAILKQLRPLNDDPSHFVAIKKLFYDRRYEQRELVILQKIKEKGLCKNIIELKDKYF